jgi:hypothetical protein
MPISGNRKTAAEAGLLLTELKHKVNGYESTATGDSRNGIISGSDASLNQFGFVIPYKNIMEGPFILLNFSLNIQKDQDFKNQINSIATRNIGLDQFFTNNAQGIPLDNLETIDNETLNDLYVFLGNSQGYSTQQAFLGYNTYLFDPLSNALKHICIIP